MGIFLICLVVGPARNAKVASSAAQQCVSRLPQGSLARAEVVRTLESSTLNWSRVISWHRSIDDAVARVVRGEPQNASCALVASSPLLLCERLGAHIDQHHDVIMRINFAPTLHYEAHVGSRTDMRFMALVYVPRNRSEQSVVLHRYHRRGDSFYQQDRTANSMFSVVQLKGGPMMKVGGKPPLPSSGYAGVVAMMKSCASVSLYGFDLHGVAPGHYFDDSTEGHAAAMRESVATEPWRVTRAPDSLKLPRGVLKLVGGRNGTQYQVVEAYPGAYAAYITRDYKEHYLKSLNHDFRTERETLLAFVKAGCVSSARISTCSPGPRPM